MQGALARGEGSFPFPRGIEALDIQTVPGPRGANASGKSSIGFILVVVLVLR
jgi:hypothetical protein